MTNTALPNIKDISGEDKIIENFISIFALHDPQNALKRMLINVQVLRDPKDVSKGYDLQAIALTSQRPEQLANQSTHNFAYNPNGSNLTDDRFTKDVIRSTPEYHNRVIKEFRLSSKQYYNKNMDQYENVFQLEEIYVNIDGTVNIIPVVDRSKVQITDTIKEDVLSSMSKEELMEYIKKITPEKVNIVEAEIPDREKIEEPKKKGRPFKKS